MPPDAPHAPHVSVPRRPALQGPLDRRLYHPLAAALARRLAATAVTPNMVSVAGGLAIVAAGIAYVQPGWPLTAAAGLLLHMGWHVLDGADGDLARMTGRDSPIGELVDGLADYLGHVILYLLLAGAAFAAAGWIAWALAIAAGASRIVQASFYESQRRQYQLWVHDVPWLRSSATGAGAGGAGLRLVAGGAGLRFVAGAYLRVAGWLAPGDAVIDCLIADPLTRDSLRSRLRALGPAALSGHMLLGANSRTLALGAAMLAGSPLWYFVYEAVLLNLLLVAAVRSANRTRARLRDAQPDPSTVR